MSSNGQARIGIRSAITNSPIIPTTTISASLLQSLYGAWNGDTTTNELSTSLYGVWNGEYSGTASLETSLYGAWNGEALGTSLDTSIFRVYNGDNVNDTSGNAQNGTNVGGVTFTTGKIGNAFTFNGSNYVSLPDNSLNSLTGDFSISLWFFLANSTSGFKTVVSAYINTGGLDYGWELDIIDGVQPYFAIYGSTTVTLQRASTFTSGWNHFVVTRKGSTGTKMYHNGNLVINNTSTVNPRYNSTTYASIGALKYGTSSVAQFTPNGNLIDALSVWNKELTAGEVVNLYNSGNGAEYPFSTQSLATYNDAVGTNHGISPSSTLTGGVPGPSFTTGKIGKAFIFDGINDYVALPNNSLNLTGDFSFSLWINASSFTSTREIISTFTNNGSNYYGWDLWTNSGVLKFSIYNGTAAQTDLVSSTLSTNTWYHIVVTRKANTGTKIYINGSLISSNSSSVNPVYYSTNNSDLGAAILSGAGRNYFIGNIDAVSVWNRELTSNEVSMLYNGSNGTQYSSGSFGLTQSSLDSFGTYHGTLMSGCTYTTGKLGNAFTFDGVDDYVALPDNIFNFTGHFSISCWFYASTNTTNSSGLIGNYNDATSTGFGMYLYQNRLYAQLANASGKYSTTYVDNSVLNAWNHAVMVFKKGTGFYLYMNGVLRNSFTTANNANAGTSPSYSATQKAYIGLLNYSGDWWWMQNGGKIDGVNVWQRAILQDEITQLYNSGTGAQYPFTGTFSSAGNQLGVDNGTLVNGCSLTTGKVGQAFTFDGVNDYVQLPDNSLNFTGDFSVSAWIYVANVSGEKFLISNVNGNAIGLNFGWCFGLYDNKLSFGSYGNTVYSAWMSGDTLLVNTWYHVLVTKKSSQKPKYYINGNLSTSTLHPNCTGTDSTNPIYSSVTYPIIRSSIGTYIYNNGSNTYAYWNGKIDALNVWQKELTQSEITELYNSGNGKQITTTPIVQNGLVLNLDASRSSSYPNTGTTWTDISGSGNNGTLVNGPIFGTANGGVINFDGVNDYVDLGTKSSLAPGTTDFTISFWINPNNWGSLSSTSYSPIFVTLVNGGLWIGKNGANFVLRTAYIADDVQYSVLPTVNQWTMVTVNRVGNIAKIYYNGSVVASATVTRNYVSGNSYLGVDIPSNGNFSNIKLSTFSYYNRGLSDSEVTQNFNATKSRFGL